MLYNKYFKIMQQVLNLENGEQEVKLIQICNQKDLIFNWH